MAEATMKTATFTKDAPRMSAEKLKAKLVAKFTAAKIGNVRVNGNDVLITANLSATQWGTIKMKLAAVGYHLELDPDF